MGIKFNTRGLEELARKIELAQRDIDLFIEKTAKELASRLLAEVTNITPVGDYPKQKKLGGNLRRGWSNDNNDNFRVIRDGDKYIIRLINNVEYASYVNSGHRTKIKKDGTRGWVEGQFFIKLAEEEITSITPALLEQRLEIWLRSYVR